MTNAFEYGDAVQEADPSEDNVENPATAGTRPYLGLSTRVNIWQYISQITDTVPIRFRMVVLADELLEAFFEADLSASFRLDEPAVPIPEEPSGILGNLVSTLLTQENKQLFNRFADEVGKSMGKHHVRYSIFLPESSF
jgi:hypothetical protein